MKEVSQIAHSLASSYLFGCLLVSSLAHVPLFVPLLNEENHLAALPLTIVLYILALYSSIL